MTIGIGVLASSKPKPAWPRPDSIVLIADTMGSTETDSTDALHKMWLDDDAKLYAVAAGTMEYGGEIFDTASKAISNISGPRTHGEISAALNQAFQVIRAQHFQWDIVWSKLQIPGIAQLADTATMRTEWEAFQINIHMIFGTLDHKGQAHLYAVGQFDSTSKVVHLCEFPGYWAIGTGGGNANSWLNYRGQYLGSSIKQSAYHAYEAKRMAARTPTVNDAVEIAVIMPGKGSFHLTDKTPELDGCPVSIPELESTFSKLGPQSTNPLGHQQSAVQKAGAKK